MVLGLLFVLLVGVVVVQNVGFLRGKANDWLKITPPMKLFSGGF